MSNTQLVFIHRNAIPQRDQLQQALDELGFPVGLDPDFTPLEDFGFSPCLIAGNVEAGFEISYDDAIEEILSDDGTLHEAVGDRDFCISLTWRSSEADFLCVMATSAAYMKSCDAVISFEGNEPMSLAELISETKRLMVEVL